jgi:hypothetical protein
VTNACEQVSDIEHDERRRAAAIQDATDYTRRAAAAVSAARTDIPDGHRRCVLIDAHRRLLSVLRELQQLAQ